MVDTGGLTRRKSSDRLVQHVLLRTGLVTGQSAAALPVIPSSEDRLPVIVMGTWITFIVVFFSEMRAARTEVMRAFLGHGCGRVDSSAIYRSAQEVIRHSLGAIGDDAGLFSATKVWARSVRAFRSDGGVTIVMGGWSCLI